MKVPAASMTSPDFSHIETWVFDLDNTLYPSRCNLFAQVDERMGAFISEFLKVDLAEARRIQKLYYVEHGTTLNGLMHKHDIDPDHFLNTVHAIDYSPVAPHPDLVEAIASLPGRKFIFTNGSKAHAEAVAARLGVTDHFEDIFDIVAADLVPKPAEETYTRFWQKHGIVPQRAAMFEDLSRNLEVPDTLGMTTVLVVPGGTREVFQEDWEMEGRDAPHVDFVTDDLGAFLGKVLDARG